MGVQAVVVTEYGGPEVLKAVERPDPVPAAGEVVVRVRAVTINPSDLAVRAGALRALLPDLEPPFVPGWDIAGEVAALGEGVTAFAPGDRVAGLVPFAWIGGRTGTYAEAVAVEAEWLVRLPDEVAFPEAATLPLNALTARQGLDLLALRPGATLLVTGASGAVGGYATQLAVRDGMRVVAVAGRDDEAWVAGLGAEKVLPRDTDLSTLSPVDAVFDAVPLGPAAVTPALRDCGEVVFTRHPQPPTPERGIRYHTVLVRPDRTALHTLAGMLADGSLRTRIGRTVPLDAAAEGHRLAESGTVRGKVVLTA